MMKRRGAILWIALGGACLAILAAAMVIRGRNAPKLPAEARYANLPDLFGKALQGERDRARKDGFPPDDVRALAHLYQANRLNDEARACYEVLRAKPGGLDAQDHYYLADIAQYQGDLVKAELELRSAIGAEPQYLPAHLALSDVLFKSGRPDAAEKEYRNILAMVPNQPQAMFGLARVDLLGGNDDAAVARLETLLASHPEMTSGAALLAQIFDRRGDEKRAAAMTQWSRQQHEPVPEDPWMDALEADCYDVQRLGLKFEEYFASGQIALAVPLLRRVEDLDPKSPIPQLLRGWTQARDHNDAEAVKQYRLALEKGGDPEKICPYIVQSLLAVGNVSEAASLMAEYHAKKPDSVPILVAYSEVALRQGDNANARVLLAKVLEKEPYLYSANMSLARILWASGERDDAAKCLERAAKASENDVASRALLGEYYLGKSDPASAITPLEHAAGQLGAQTPQYRSLVAMLYAAYLQYGRIEEDKGQLSGAVGTYDKAILLLPDEAVGYARKAVACALSRQFDGAAAALLKLKSLQPGNPTVYLSLGDVLYQGGDRDRARLNWQKALELTAADNGPLRNAIGQRLSGPITEDTFR
jgi:tetratricopeptide (TPR) repeat protein